MIKIVLAYIIIGLAVTSYIFYRAFNINSYILNNEITHEKLASVLYYMEFAEILNVILKNKKFKKLSFIKLFTKMALISPVLVIINLVKLFKK